MYDLKSFVEPVNIMKPGNAAYEPLQLGQKLETMRENSDWDSADIVLVGCGEWRGADSAMPYSASPDAVREQLYKMFHWHNVQIADAGNIKQGSTLDDTNAALLTVLQEIHSQGKAAIVLGGSHDLTLQQYNVFKKAEKTAVATMADMLIDLAEAEDVHHGSFLMDMLTGTPNFVSHYSHIAFQSYYVNPRMLETLDKLRFDFYRVGKVREYLEEMEPVLRSSDMFSFDMSAIKYSDAPANVNGSPNGLTGDEACQLARYAGMSSRLSSFGIYGYNHLNDVHSISAKQMAQMIWYFIDGYHIRKSEADLVNREEFVEYNVSFTENDTTFLKSKRTGRWWMQLPNASFVPCSYSDYLVASKDEIPERWLREQERVM